jgi:hypothetical protein
MFGPFSQLREAASSPPEQAHEQQRQFEALARQRRLAALKPRHARGREPDDLPDIGEPEPEQTPGPQHGLGDGGGRIRPRGDG